MANETGFVPFWRPSRFASAGISRECAAPVGHLPEALDGLYHQEFGLHCSPPIGCESALTVHVTILSSDQEVYALPCTTMHNMVACLAFK